MLAKQGLLPQTDRASAFVEVKRYQHT